MQFNTYVLKTTEMKTYFTQLMDAQDTSQVHGILHMPITGQSFGIHDMLSTQPDSHYLNSEKNGLLH
jgi:hypothetical protein